ncbi:MAG: SDR family oxidoreductase [Pelagibacterales bacterium]|nr:SDR family oxidoreductase [Pelagibacterales bacterium]
MSLLIIGSTGTLGRQIVLQALTKGYQVRCLVRNLRKASFLKEWGAELVYGDLTLPETIPPCLKGITAVIDASTSRPSDLSTIKQVDWDGKLALIETCKTAKIKRFIFCSALHLESYPNIPLIDMKQKIEIKLQKSNIPYTILRLPGFYQGLIEQYAIPILEDLPIWITDEKTKISYIDTQDIAKFCLRALQLPKTENQIYSIAGPKEWSSSEIIKLCEQLAGQSAQVRKIPISLLKLTSNFLGFFEWGQNVSDRLAFVEILSLEGDRSESRLNLYETFKIDPSDIVQLDDYFLEYFIRLLKRLKDINFEDVQKQKNLVI